MKKIKYFYNTHTLRYEKFVTPFRVRLLRLFGFLSALAVSSLIIIYLYNRFFPKPGDLESRRKYAALKENFDLLQGKIKTIENDLGALEKRDNEVYRSIFEANPLPDSARAKLIEKQKEFDKVSSIDEGILGKDIAAQLNNLNARIAFQQKKL